MKKVFRELVSLDEAIDLIMNSLGGYDLGIEEVDIESAAGRVLAEDVRATSNVPPFSRSLRDGYAVRYQDVSRARETNPIRLKVIGEARVGCKTDLYVGPGQAVEIDTGAMVPGGANAIVMEEYTERDGDELLVYKSVGPGEHIQQVGADSLMGDTIAYKGTLLGPREVGALAAVGVKSVRVYRKPMIGVISTGDEIVEQGATLGPGEIYDVNGPLLMSVLRRMGLDAKYYGVVRDDAEEIYNMIVKAMRECDMIITSGSTSVGTRDMLYKILGEIEDSTILFHGVKQRPGRPTIVVKVRDKLVFGLPGFPVSALMIFYNIVHPVLMHLLGLKSAKNVVMAILGNDARGETGRVDLIPVILKRDGEGYRAFPLAHDSSAIVSLTLAEGYITIPEDQLLVESGEEVAVTIFEDEEYTSEVVISGSHSIGFNEVLSKYVELSGVSGIKRVWTGSSGVFESIRIGYGDLGGTHLYDPDSGEYNIPFVEKYRLKDVLLYRGFQRLQGFVVPKGNPHHISGIDDVIEKGLRFINRSKGSGTRQLIDNLVRDYAEGKGLEFRKVLETIEGYYVEAKTHDAVVTAVEAGHADVGVAIRPATLDREVDFIPISNEYYDILVSKNSLEKEVVRDLVRFIFSDEAKKILSRIEGICVDEDFGKVLVDA